MTKKCGYPLCRFYSEEIEEMDCPTPIEGAACQGMIEETDEMDDHAPECRCEICRFWS